jgi:hypothetical protein
VENPFTLEIYDKNFVFKGFIGNPIALTVTPRFNETSTAMVMIDANHKHATTLTTPGCRMVIRKDGMFLMSGKIHLSQGEGPEVSSILTLFVKGDFRLLHQVTGWPVPTSAITSQSGAEYAKYTGNAETIFKNVVSANIVNRLGMDVTVASNQNRGATVPDGVSFRFHTLYEKLFPAIEQAGLGVTFEQEGSSILVDVYEPQDFGFVLTEESGALQNWSWSSEDPTATRVIAGGQGEGTARVFRSVVDTALETDHNDVIEIFRDARDADTTTVLTSRAQETLTEGKPKSGFTVKLSETETFQYGKNGLVVGAMVTVSIGGVTRTDVLREVTMSLTRDNGVEVTPLVGEIRDNPDRAIANFLARLKKSISDLKVSK